MTNDEQSRTEHEEILRSLREAEDATGGSRAAAEQVLAALAVEVSRIEGEVEAGNARRGDVWMDGMSCGAMAERLATVFQGWPETLQSEEKSTQLWCRSVLAVSSHYHHIVGPAMLAWADCLERLGDLARAAHVYRSVVADFAWLVDELEEVSGEGAELCDDDVDALEALERAAKRGSSVVGDPCFESDCQTLLQRIAERRPSRTEST